LCLLYGENGGKTLQNRLRPGYLGRLFRAPASPSQFSLP
jgi:hypothetical protein